MNERNAKEIFLRSPHREAFEKIVQTEQFQVALDYCLLDFVQSQPSQASLEQGWDAHSRLSGAREFVERLLNFHRPDAKGAPRLFPTLKPPQ